MYARLSRSGKVLIHQAGAGPRIRIMHMAPNSWCVLNEYEDVEDCGVLTDDQLLERFKNELEVLANLEDFCSEYRLPEIVEFADRIRKASLAILDAGKMEE